jgi:hypothetical protein
MSEDKMLQNQRPPFSLEQAVKDKNGGNGYPFLNAKTGKPWYDVRKAIARAALRGGVTKRVYTTFCGTPSGPMPWPPGSI